MGRRSVLFLVGVAVLLAGMVPVRCAAAADQAIAYAPPVIPEEQALEWQRDAIRQGFAWDIATRQDIQVMPCLVRGGCPVEFPSREVQFSRIQKALASGQCKDLKSLNPWESFFCQLLRSPGRELFDRFCADSKRSYSDTECGPLAKNIAHALGYVKGGRQCKKFVRLAAGNVPSAWTDSDYEGIVECKLLFEGAKQEQIVTDLAFFRFAREEGTVKRCASIRDADIRAFCRGPFPKPLEDKP